MSHLRIAAACLLTAAFLLTVGPVAAQGEPNHGTIKVHDEETASPETRNEPHVDCEDFWVQGFNMAADNGTLSFYTWPPSGDKTLVLVANWTGTWNEDGRGTDFTAGPFTLPPGHYRVEASNAPGHVKSKMFWVEECPPGEGEEPPAAMECPPDLRATARGDGSVQLDWTLANGSVGTNIYRATGSDDFVWVATVDAPTATFVDTDVDVGTTYAYTVTGLYEDEAGTFRESNDCPIVEVTTIPEFPTALALGLATLGGALAYLGVAFRRRA